AAQRDQAQPRQRGAGQGQRGAGQGQSRRTAQVYTTTSSAPAASQGRPRSAGSRRVSRPQGN
ncbi:MAG: hypothetical protein WBA87_12870, partial [Microbacterium sp.]